MTDSCEIDVEVAGSIVTSNGEETITESRRTSNAKEESAEEKPSRRRSIEKTVVWKTFKSLVFFICLIFLIVQSVEFLTNYYKYPTAIELETTLPEDFKLPAVTLCFRNTISFKEFCLHEPDRCERPSDMEEFCTKHPIHCEEDNSTLKIPSQDEKTRRIMKNYLFNDSYNDEKFFQTYEYKSKARTFVEDIEDSYLFLKCYSENLHLFGSGSKQETQKIYPKHLRGHLLEWWYELDMSNIEFFYPLNHPLVFVAIHSPFVPLDPELDLYPIRRGAIHRVFVQLKEEHLLPPPYQTDCRDSGPSEYAKEFTNPNSHQVCLEMCLSKLAKAVSACDWGTTMVFSPSDLCDEYDESPDLSEKERDEAKEKHTICKQNCKHECLKLQYKYRIKEIDLKNPYDRYRSNMRFYIKNPEVTVLRHVPVYGSGDVFSHIGGLLGCWLGVSVFALTDILEKFFRKVIRWKRSYRKRRFRKRKVQRAPPTSEIHQD